MIRNNDFQNVPLAASLQTSSNRARLPVGAFVVRVLPGLVWALLSVFLVAWIAKPMFHLMGPTTASALIRSQILI
jgi:hypothetical protein